MSVARAWLARGESTSCFVIGHDNGPQRSWKLPAELQKAMGLVMDLSNPRGTSFGLLSFAISGQCSYCSFVRSSTSHMLGYDVTRGIPGEAFSLAVYPGTNLPKADLPDSVPPRAASVCDELS